MNTNSKVRSTLAKPTELLVEAIEPTGQIKPIRGLLDTGSSKSIVLRHVVKPHQVLPRTNAVKWQTMAGTMTTNSLAQVDIRLPKLSKSKTVTWDCHIDDTTRPNRSPYDIILGIDFISIMTMTIDFAENIIKWGDSEMELLPYHNTTHNKSTTYAASSNTVIKQAKTTSKQNLRRHLRTLGPNRVRQNADPPSSK